MVCTRSQRRSRRPLAGVHRLPDAPPTGPDPAVKRPTVPPPTRRPPASAMPRLAALAWAALVACAAPAALLAAEPSAPEPRRTRAAVAPGVAASGPVPRTAADRDAPVVIQARSLSGSPERETVAEGEVELRRGDLLLQADQLRYRGDEDLAVARGRVRVMRDGSVFRGPELQLKLDAFEGYFLMPEFDFARVGAGGRADRIDFIDRSRVKASNALYTSCPRDGAGDPAWLLSTRRLSLDFETNEGIAEGAVLRFLGLPLLALPTMSFPVTGARKSGWLPPSVNLDNRSGFELAVPYYWNIAPNRDATLTPRIATRRGVAGDVEFRYLEPGHAGSVGLDLLPRDEVAGRTRHALRLNQEGTFGSAPTPEAAPSWRYGLRAFRVSDDDWWKDFPRSTDAFTPRLLPLQAEIERGFGWSGLQGLVYARARRWQVLQSAVDAVVSPYERSPQAGATLSGPLPGGFELALEAEVNRFTLPGASPAGRPTGLRAHTVGAVGWPRREPGWWVVPRLALNAAGYDLDQALPDGRTRLSRTVPTASLDAGLEFERETWAFGRALRQTLEPRLLFVRTPYREQSPLLVFDAAGKDFNFSSIFSENEFSGIDRVSDAQQLTAGVTTRLLDRTGGAELLRLGVVQRFNFADQRITPEGAPFTRRASDLLLLGSTSVIPAWTLDASLRYNADSQRAVRSVLSARYAPGEFRTVSATYRFTRSLSEQVELGWQWPIATLGSAAAATNNALRPGTAGAGATRCGGRLYGVGRVNYSVRDSRVTDSILGLEFDAGCWIGRVIAERLSTGRTEATTRLLLQLELVGLSRAGANPMRVLKDNIPGYRLLREERDAPSQNTTYD